METAVDKLEAMFQKTEADMEYIEKRLRLDFLTNASENGTVDENPVKLLENLSAIKARHAALCAQVQEIEAEQKQSMDSIRAHLGTTVQLVQQLQQTADEEVPPLTEAEQLSTEFLGLTVKEDTAEVPVSIEVQAQEQPQSPSEFEELSEATLEAVPRSVRSNVKLAGLNAFYRQLQEHFSSRRNSGHLSLQKMKQLNMKVSDAKLKTLEHLGLVDLDKKGHVRLL
ncbi:spindle and kinetochore-associated protein 2 isoform X1 [Hypomesus transpacificus]|uniref:spindle and kinetochore-associated protein 2 isoform X1 n=2 Tax=Hypomesus transpacificus TaxID=137520 RepID=UPI001F082A79|nr:spindle and kinetochore-associated protein 2 isoform X1 [Hypomesus transpacificus]